jgi:single-strand DNA-binding protein
MANFNLNKVMVAGRLTADPELRTTPSGVATTSFSIAVNGRGKDSQVVYIDAVAWRQQAEFITKYFKKGSSIYIEGALNPRNWTDD